MFIDERGGTESEGNVTPHQGYMAMKSWLYTYVSGGIFVTNIRPYQLPYRAFNVYLMDIGGYPAHVQDHYMRQLRRVVKGRPTRLYLFWTGETWDAFCRVNPDLADFSNCINCCEGDALEKIDAILLDMDN
ncbi:MAG: hypothetical protein AMS22_08415 [Thiotrichales bacterium SG8_50]|nr:MAG: hypothetical protein AMS22_08415 [Thiotrichales bacterium SG8_50]